jgi:hypothetical protein
MLTIEELSARYASRRDRALPSLFSHGAGARPRWIRRHAWTWRNHRSGPDEWYGIGGLAAGACRLTGNLNRRRLESWIFRHAIDLAGYIFGNNRANEKMEMTAPVSQRKATGDGDRLEMTEPVTQRPKVGAGSDTYVLSFVMPSR